MGTLQNAFEMEVEKNFGLEALTRGSVRNAARISGLQLSETEIVRASAAIKHAEKSGAADISFVGDNGQQIEITADALNSGLKQVERRFSKSMKAIPKIVDTIAPTFLKQLYATAPAALRHQRQLRQQFRRRLRARWRGGLDRLEMLSIIVQETHNRVIADFDCPKEKRSRQTQIQFEALIRLHARASRTFAEIQCLLGGGHADGANARWRSLHELAVISYFLSQRPAKASRLYLEHEVVEQWKAAQQYQVHAPSLGYPQYTSAEMAAMQKRHDAVIKKHGKAFEGDYGWAAVATGCPRQTFSEIERISGFSKWRPFYKMACHSIHAGAKGCNFSLGSLGDGGARFLIASNAGLCDPGHCAAISMTLISTSLLTKWSNLDHLVTLRVMLQLSCEIGEAFSAANARLEADSQPA